MKRLLFFALIALPSVSFTQNCTIKLTGYVKDELTGEVLTFSNIYNENDGSGAVADDKGYFSFKNMCPGGYHFRVSRIGCEPKRIYIDLKRDTSIIVVLHHHSESLKEVTVSEKATKQPSAETIKTISSHQIEKESGKPLAKILETVPGVSSLDNGSGISKPVVNGLYGNRLTILNNGIPQAGQQWGNDHAPEIDPNAANNISVVKGAGSLEYGGNSLGTVVLIEPGVIPKDPHLHGIVNYTYETNGRGHTLSSRVEKSNSWADWRLTGTLKYYGDRRTPDYYLNNTGNREANFSAQLRKNLSRSWLVDLYYSFYSTETGILRGAHIGNLTDLQQAIGRETPFFTEDNFSYGISAPKQRVAHHLIKLSSKYFIKEHNILSLTYSSQFDSRKEYDVRRGEFSDVPALSLALNSHIIDLQYSVDHNKTQLKMGIQSKVNNNTNDPETGILPLIPDYRLYNEGAYIIWKKTMHSFLYELGGRYDLNLFQVTAISRTLPHSIERSDHKYNNFTFSSGLKYEKNKHFSSKINLGLAERSPEVNELYSFGLHQGVAGLEIGNPGLNPEQSIKAIWTNNLSIADKLSLEGTLYYQRILDYIYLEPQQEFQLTIRGAFPVFLYKQTNANISGADLLLDWQPTDHWDYSVKYSAVRGHDITNDKPLIYMPSDKISSSLGYLFPESPKFKNIRISMNGSYVFKQTRLDADQDFLAPPDAYFLLGADFESQYEMKKQSIKLTLSVENLLNEKYRDYLNRLRYYADDEGRSIRIGVLYDF